MRSYRLIISILFLPLLFWFLIGILRGKITPREFKARFGKSESTTNGPKPSIWLHAASNGELTSALPILKDLKNESSAKDIIVTCNTLTAVFLAKKNGFRACIAPIDYLWAISAFYERENINSHIIMESEIWPNRIDFLSKKNVPILVLGGRITDKTAYYWVKLEKLAITTFRKIDYLSAQNSSSLVKFQNLGLRAKASGPILNLKSLYKAVGEPEKRSKRCNTWLAASTHPGEEEMILEAFSICRKKWPTLRLIIAPRHPHRSPFIQSLIKRAGFTYICRSSAENSEMGNRDILLADTLGEMSLWYKKAGICIIGGTFKQYGGHTPYEPSAYNCAIAHGPFTENFSREFKALDMKGATRTVSNHKELSEQLLKLKNPSEQERVTKLAINALQQGQAINSILATTKHLLLRSYADSS